MPSESQQDYQSHNPIWSSLAEETVGRSEEKKEK